MPKRKAQRILKADRNQKRPKPVDPEKEPKRRRRVDPDNDNKECRNIRPVEKLYNFIDQILLLGEIQWIRGCVVSKAQFELEVSVSEERAQNFFKMLKIPKSLMNLLKFNCNEPVRAELAVHKYGTGDEIESKITMSLMGFLGESSYAFSASHAVARGVLCHTRDPGNKAVAKEMNCENSVFIVDTENVNKAKVYDAALFRFKQKKVPQKNKIATKNVRLDRPPYDTEHAQKLGWKVLVSGKGQESQEGKVTKVLFTVENNRFVFNAFQIEGGQDFGIHRGQSHCGSLVTSFRKKRTGPELGKAFGMIFGHVKGDPRKALAVPLWENLSKVCEGVLDINSMNFEEQE